MKDQDKPDILENLPSALPWVVSIAALLLLLAYVAAFHALPADKSPPAWGSFGDYVGGLLNPLISAFTLIVAVKVWRQQKTEMAETKRALQEQAKTAEQQRQEQRFFDLLKLYQETVASITLVARMSPKSEVPVVYSGKEAIAHFFRSDTGAISGFMRDGFYAPPLQAGAVGVYSLIKKPEYVTRGSLSAAWHDEKVASLFDHYFRVLFRVLAEAEYLLKSQHFVYVKLLRAQLSRDELKLIALNLWLDEEGKKMIPLAEKYGILKHLPNGKPREQLQADMPPAVFGRRFSDPTRNNAPLEMPPC